MYFYDIILFIAIYKIFEHEINILTMDIIIQNIITQYAIYAYIVIIII